MGEIEKFQEDLNNRVLHIVGSLPEGVNVFGAVFNELKTFLHEKHCDGTLCARVGDSETDILKRGHIYPHWYKGRY